MKKYLLIRKEEYRDEYTVTEFDALQDIVEEVEGNFKDVIVAKSVKIKFTEETETVEKIPI